MTRLGRKTHQTPLWLLSYADMATLILCFMVLLTSLSVIDERLKHDVLGSVNKRYTSSLAIPLPDNPEAFDLAKLVEGQGEREAHGRDFTLLKQQVLSDELGDMVFQENSYVQIISLSEEALFEPGTTTLSTSGRTALDRIMPFLVQIQYPLLVAGHASSRMDEEGPTYSIADDPEDPAWKISFERAFAVYSYIAEHGVSTDQLTLEAFGDHSPRFTMKTPEGRARNRRVDLVLDKRNRAVAEGLKKTRKVESPDKMTHEIDGFLFDLSLPGESDTQEQKDEGAEMPSLEPVPQQISGTAIPSVTSFRFKPELWPGFQSGSQPGLEYGPQSGPQSGKSQTKDGWLPGNISGWLTGTVTGQRQEALNVTLAVSSGMKGIKRRFHGELPRPDSVPGRAQVQKAGGGYV